MSRMNLIETMMMLSQVMDDVLITMEWIKVLMTKKENFSDVDYEIYEDDNWTISTFNKSRKAFLSTLRDFLTNHRTISHIGLPFNKTFP